MFQFFVQQGQVRDNHAYITGGDVNHICNVLRMKADEKLRVVMEDDPNVYICSIESFASDMVTCRVLETVPASAELPAEIVLFQGLPKGDKMELIIQKAVELGASRIVPVRMKNAVVKLDDKKAAGKVERWNLIAQAAAKQAKRDVIPTVERVMSYSEAVKYMSELDVRLLAYELSDADGMDKTRDILSELKGGESIGIMIGPEGGFDKSEVDTAVTSGITPITLGHRILRTETAGLMFLSWLVYVLEK